jgi:threonine aldolase
MVFASIPSEQVEGLSAHLKQAGIRILPNSHLRLVTHLDISKSDIAKVVDSFSRYFG